MKKQSEIVIMYDDDIKIIDYIADIKDKEILIEMDRMYEQIRKGNIHNFAFLYNVQPQPLVILILCNAPFNLNTGHNKLMLYAHSECRILATFFRANLERTEQHNSMYIPLNQITRMLYLHYADKDGQKALSDFQR